MIGPLRTSIATVCLGGTLDEKLDAIAAAGFDGVELFENDVTTSDLTPEQIRERLDALGLRLDLLQPLRDLDAVAPDVFAANLRRAEAKFDLMQRLGTDLLLVTSNVATATVDDDAVIAGQLAALADAAAARGLRIAYEALAWGRYISTTDRAWRVVRLADRPNLGLCVDSFHMLARWTDPAMLADVPGDKIFFCQLADAAPMQLDVLTWSRHHRNFPGEGSFDLTGFTRRLLDTGYAGPLSLEVFNDVFRRIEPRSTAVEAMRSLIVLADAVGEAPLPPLGVARSVDHLELAGPAGRTAELLRAFGFTPRTARGRSMQVFESGGARVLVRDRAADPVRLAGLGFGVPDPHAAADRARALNLPEVAVPSAPVGARRAFQAPNGVTIRFARADGGPAAVPQPADPPLVQAIDHVSLVETWKQVEEAIFVYRSLLGLTVSKPEDVLDPGGLVRSQSLANHDDSVRLAINVLPTDDCDSSGEHVAFRTTDLAACVRRLRDAGVPVLAMPRNYYDDLAARLGLDPELVDALREHDILYDRDPTGAEYLQAYADLGDGLEFEFVERRGAYRGYGAVNAPTRRAAQLRARRGARERMRTSAV